MKAPSESDSESVMKQIDKELTEATRWRIKRIERNTIIGFLGLGALLIGLGALLGLIPMSL